MTIGAAIRHMHASSAEVHTTPNAVMRTLAAPSAGATELAVWEVAMTDGQAGPAHKVDREQVWVVLEGSLSVRVGANAVRAEAGDAVALPAGGERQVTAHGEVRALVSSAAPITVQTAEGGKRPLPWAV